METFTFLMTTTFYPPNHIGGDATFVKYLAEELVKRGHEVHVMTSIDAYHLKKKRDADLKLQNPAVTVHYLKSPYDIFSPLSAYTFGSSRYYSRRFTELVDRIKPDVLHHHNISLLGNGLLKKSDDYITIHTTHDFWVICPTYGLTTNNGELCTRKRCLLCTLSHKHPPQLWRYFPTFERKVLDLDLIISPSELFRDVLSRAIKRRIVNISNFVPAPPKNTPDSIFSNYFLFTGGLEKVRGVPTLLNVFSGEDIQSKLIVVGTGSLAKYVTEFIKRKRLQSKIIYVGWASNEERNSLYKSALATIIPSEYPANFPLVALESMSHGTPVIGSNKGGLPEIVEKVDKKLVYNSVSELKRILLKFDKSKYPSEMVKSIYEKYYTPEAHMKKYFESIRSCK
jgi:glycosyltransferase involved in cell wall biosynthesis